MNRKILLLLFTSVLVFTSCKKDKNEEGSNPPPPVTQQDITALDSKVVAFMNSYNIPGASLAVSRNGKLVYQKGYGFADKTTSAKVTSQSIFRLASVSKTFTGIAILKLIEDGKLSADANVFGTGGVLSNDYGTPPYNSNLTAITVRDLLQHVSGSWGAATGGDVIDQNPSYTNKQMLDWVINTRPNPKTPGSVFDYSNVNFFILGRIIEKVSGKSYADYVKQFILSPLGITKIDIAGATAADKKPGEVSYYGQGNDAAFVYNILFSRRDADAGWIASAPDLLKFVCAFDGFSTRQDIINSDSYQLLKSASAVNKDYGFGIGIWPEENLLFNYGSLPGTRTAFMRHDNGTNAVLLLNSRVDPTTDENPFIYAMQDLVLDVVTNSAYKWQDIDQFSK